MIYTSNGSSQYLPLEGKPILCLLIQKLHELHKRHILLRHHVFLRRTCIILQFILQCVGASKALLSAC